MNFDKREKRAFLIFCTLGSSVGCGVMAAIAWYAKET